MYVAIHIPSEYDDTDPHPKFVVRSSSPSVVQQSIDSRYVTVATGQGCTIGDMTNELRDYDSEPKPFEYILDDMPINTCRNVHVGNELFIVTRTQ